MRGEGAYRGYLIRRNPFTDAWFIEKDQLLIGWAKDAEDARRIVDSLVEE